MSALLAEIPERIQLINKAAMTVQEEARALVVSDQETLNSAAAFVQQRIKPLLAEADATFDPVIAAGLKAHREAIAAKRKVTEPLVEAEAIAKRYIGNFIRAQEEARRAEERRLREAEERRQAEIREQEIEAAEREGAPAELVQAMVEEPLPIITRPTVAPTFQKPAGIPVRETWSAEVFSIRDLCRAIADGQPEALVQPNQTVLNAMARAAKNTMNIPGVRAVSDSGVTARRG